MDKYLMKTDQQFINMLEDQIWQWGAPTKLISNHAQVEISNQVKEILHAYCITDWQSEPHHQHQNYTEQQIQQLKSLINTIMDHTSAPANTWFLCLQYVASILNFTYSEKIKCTPLFALMGSTNDISMLLYFHFWEPIYFWTGEKPIFPSESCESCSRFVSFPNMSGMP